MGFIAQRIRRGSVAFVAIAVASGCHSAKTSSAAPKPELHPLSGITGEPLMVAPVQSMRVSADLAWTVAPKPALVLSMLDSALTDSLRARIGSQQWVYAAALVKSFSDNSLYATDPRAFSVQPLRAAKLKIDDRLPEPLASQLRTMIALHDGRLVLIPVELRFDRTVGGGGHPVVRLVLVDPRSSVIRWYGDVSGADAPSFTDTYSAALAGRVADLFVAK